MVFDRTGRKFIVQEKNYNLKQQQKNPKKYNNNKLQQQQKNSNHKLQKPKLKITKNYNKNTTTEKITNHFLQGS